MQLFPVSHRCHQDLSGNKPRSDTLDVFFFFLGLGWLNIHPLKKMRALFQIWANIQTYNHRCIWKTSLFLLLFPLEDSLYFFPAFLLTDVSHFLASEVKHLKPVGNIKELGSCRQLGALGAAGLQLAAPTLLAPLFSGSDGWAPPRLAPRRTVDIFPMTRGAHALK